MNKYVKYLDNIVHHDLGIDVKQPTFINLSLSNKCNSRCVMCDIWKYPSVDLYGEELFGALDNPFLNNVRTLGLTGGEPFLRKDIPEIIEYATTRFTQLQHIGITTNGFNTSRIIKLLTKYFSKENPVKLSICVSVDGFGTKHNQMRKVKRAWDNINNTIIALEAFKEYISLSIACTITNLNSDYDNLAKLHEFSISQGIPIIYRMAVKVDRIFNEELIDEVGLVPRTTEAENVVKFLDEKLLLGLNSRTIYYHMIKDFLVGAVANRSIKCKEMRDGAMLDSNGDLYICSVSGRKFGNLISDTQSSLIKNAAMARSDVRKDNCSNCFHDHLSHKSPLKLIESFFKLYV